MTRRMERIYSVARGARWRSPAALRTLRSLAPGQPLVLVPEPRNPVDRHAIVLTTVTGAECGWVAKEHAAIVSPRMARGELWLCRVRSGPPLILLWQEQGEEDRRLEAQRRREALQYSPLLVRIPSARDD